MKKTLPETCKKIYSKSSSFYTGIKGDFFSSNDPLLSKARAQNRLYLAQPRRGSCKLCSTPLPETCDLTSHGIGYKFCAHCDHLNGAYEETEQFIEHLYLDQEGAEYAKNYLSDNFQNRVKHIYQPKLDFLLESSPAGSLKKILDVGCGSGYFVHACLERGLEAEGIDVNSQMIDAGNGQLRRTFGVEPLTRVREDDFYERIAGTNAGTISALGVLEHLRTPGRFFDAFSKSGATQIFFSVPMFSNSVIFENVFQEVFPRQLSGAHTHLFTEKSIRWLYEHNSWMPLAEWRFGSDFMDLYRAMLVTLKSRGGSEQLLRRFEDEFADNIDAVQGIFDRRDFCSEIHSVAKKIA